MTKPSLVLFDLGNVLVKFTPESFWQTLGLQRKNERALSDEGVKKAADEFECGKLKTGEFFNELEKIFENRFRREQLRHATASVLTNPIPNMERIVSKVAQRVSVALVSNTNEFHYAYCMEAIPAMKMLPKHYLSYKLGVMKPKAGFFRKVLKEEKAKAESVVFVDDVEENVAGAQSAGMVGILFKNPTDLETHLKNLKVF